ncbi:c-type cytochrome [Reichenbachiella carrageenanivorans]|uniref:C-type cytochrome n=1 Tax=Reichenbachiella carrageenanivorans TaxID=2979869 RepID=A0ABY6CVM8_9BACT|nr:cytochrome c peroxidase [Reichenbachiella carrageenanivorans]UXX77961.1 c-type cytochrome [Reichenbachiella carrageenanivorans]
MSYPSYFPAPIATPQRNELTTTGVALGQRLFFDSSLSPDGKIACASCHQQAHAFTDGQAFSRGHSGKALKRNTPALINLAWSESFFWDGGVKNLESLAFAALMSPDEMGADLPTLTQRLNRDTIYRPAFKQAFGIDSISSAFVSRAIAQYLRTLISADSKYDLVQKGTASYDSLESQGQLVFKKNCAACHTPPLFTNHQFHHNGISQTYDSKDLYLSTGRFRITKDSSDLGKYKTPTLRHLSLTAPYMHDGRFSTIEKVIDHYQNLDRTNQNQDSLVRLIEFDDIEKKALLAFLKTLDDKPL